MRRIIGIRHRWKDLAGSEGDDEGRKIEERPITRYREQW